MVKKDGVGRARDGGGNTTTGVLALSSNTAGGSNTAVGFVALQNNTTASNNTAIEVGALPNSNTDNNTATGFNALFNNTAGPSNTAYGFSALSNNNTGGFNTATGFNALLNNTTGSENIALGDGAGQAVSTASNVICIGAGVQGENVNNSCYIGQIFNATAVAGIGVFINSNGKLGTSTSSRRFKEEIKPMDKASEALFALKPVTFRYKKDIDPAGTSQFGLVAEEVERVNPDLVACDKEHKPYSVRYDQVNAMLLNEFLKEHRKVEKLEALVAQQHKDFEAALADLKGQIQKVSAELELSKPAPQTVKNTD